MAFVLKMPCNSIAASVIEPVRACLLSCFNEAGSVPILLPQASKSGLRHLEREGGGGQQRWSVGHADPSHRLSAPENAHNVLIPSCPVLMGTAHHWQHPPLCLCRQRLHR